MLERLELGRRQMSLFADPQRSKRLIEVCGFEGLCKSGKVGRYAFHIGVARHDQARKL